MHADAPVENTDEPMLRPKKKARKGEEKIRKAFDETESAGCRELETSSSNKLLLVGNSKCYLYPTGVL